MIVQPKIQLRNQVVQIQNSQWRNHQFKETSRNMIKWAILNCDHRRIQNHQIKKFKDDFLMQARNQQLNLDRNVLVSILLREEVSLNWNK